MSVRIAIASHDGLTSDVKFGEISKLYIYEFDDVLNRFCEVDVRYIVDQSEFPDSCDGNAGCNGQGNGAGCQDESHIISIARLISDCEYLLLQKTGMKPARVLLREGISVLEKGGNIDESLLSLSSYVANKQAGLMRKRSLSD